MTKLLHAVHCNLLVLGIGETESEAADDAIAHHVEDKELFEYAMIDEDAAAYVRRGGDCRGLSLFEDNVFRLAGLR